MAVGTGMPAIRLEGDYLIERAEEVHSNFRRMLVEDTEISIDCAAVTAADLSIIQLLVAAAREVERKGGSLTLQGVEKGALATAVDEAGLSHLSLFAPEG